MFFSNNIIKILVAVHILFCLESYAQIIDFGGPTTTVNNQPPPGESRINTRDVLRMTTVDLEMKISGPVFMLKLSEKEIYGPYKYKDGGRIGSKSNYYIIKEAFDNSFTLKSPKTSNSFGPFKLAHGETIKTDTASFKILIEYGYINGTFSHPGSMTKNNLIYLVPINTDTHNELSGLMYKFIGLNQKHQLYQAPRKLSTPTVVSITGQINDGTITRSKADLAKHDRSMDTQARASYQSFCKKNAKKTVKPNYKGFYSFGKLKPGRYLVCTMCTKRNEDGNKLIRSRPTFWWTGINVGAGEAIKLDFTGENDLDWRDLFVKEHDKSE